MRSSHGSVLMPGARLRGALAASSLILVASALAPAASALAPVGSEPGVPTEVVRFHDLDLNSERGVRALYGRIRYAAGEVCAPYAITGNPIPSAAWRRCFEQAVANAVSHVDSPLLTAYHERQTGHLIASAQQRRPAPGSREAARSPPGHRHRGGVLHVDPPAPSG